MRFFLFSMCVLLFVGCSSKNNLNKTFKKETFIKNDNTNLYFGNPNSKDKFVLVEEGLDGNINKKLTIYINKYPFNLNFNTCEKSGNYENIKSVKINKETGKKTPIYEEVNKKCLSYIYISEPKEDNAKLLSVSSYSLVFLEGFNIHDFQGYPLKLAVKSKTQITNHLLNFNENNIYQEKYDNNGNIAYKSYIYLGENN